MSSIPLVLTIAILVLTPVAAAGSAADPEVLDGPGDASPAAMYLATPEGAAARYAAMYDLLSAWIAGESSEALRIEVQVADLPDEWGLPPGRADGSTVPPVNVDGEPLEWSPEIWQNAVNHSLAFRVKGIPYFVEVQLAALDMETRNHAVPLDTRVASSNFFAAAHDALHRARENATVLPGLGPSSALMPALLELERATLGLAALVQASCVDEDGTLCQEDLCTSPAPRNVYCTPDRKGICLRGDVCQDLANSRSLLAQGVLSTYDQIQVLKGLLNDPLVSGLSARSTIETLLDQAVVALAAGQDAAEGPPYVTAEAQEGEAAPPRVMLFSRATLRGPDGRGVELGSPGVDLAQDRIQVVLPKALLGSPVQGDRLDQFRVVAGFDRTPMDFAPNATSSELGAALVPAYGRAYVFTYAPAVVAPTIGLSTLGETRGEVRPGGAGSFRARVVNTGPVEASGFYHVSRAPEGWTFQVSPADFRLAPGESSEVEVRVAALAGGARQAALVLQAHLDGGGFQVLRFTMDLREESSGAVDPADAPATVAPSKRDTPGFGFLLALVGLAVVARRRG